MIGLIVFLHVRPENLKNSTDKLGLTNARYTKQTLRFLNKCLDAAFTSNFTYLFISPKKMIWGGNVDVKFKTAGYPPFHGNEVFTLVGVVADANEFFNRKWLRFLMIKIN